MNSYTKICLPLFFCGACMLSTQASAQNMASDEISTSDSASQLAAEAYEKNHWLEAFINYAHLADTGNTEAARIAFQMWRYGAPLYATQFSATSAQLGNWRKYQAASVPSPNFHQHPLQQATAP